MNRRFTLNGDTLRTSALASGDLEVSGYCVVWNGLDAEGETFLKGALADAIPTFLERSGVLAWHHRPGEYPLGRVLEMREDDVGVWFRARLDKPDVGAPTRWLYDAVKRGTMRGVSIGGFFGDRVATGGFSRAIHKVLRLTEVSLTTRPMDDAPGLLNVAEVKAIMGTQPRAQLDWDGLRQDVELLHMKAALIQAERDVAAIARSRRAQARRAA